MKLAFLSTLQMSAWGGCEELWAATAELALAQGHSVVTSTTRWPAEPKRITRLREQGARTLFWNPINLLGGRIRRRLGYKPLRPLSRCDYDVLLINQSGTHDFAEFFRRDELVGLTRNFRIPYVVICHLTIDADVIGPSVRERAIFFFDHAAQVCFVSQANLDATRRHMAHAIRNARVVRNPVNLAGTDPVPYPTGQKAIFGSVSRLDARHKGHDVLIEAFAGPQWRTRDWELRLYGAGQDQAYLQTLVGYYGLQDRVKFMGHTEDIRRVWESSQLLVMASRYEGTPLALVEAMLCGRGAVVTDVGGNSEWIVEGHNGFVSPAPLPLHFAAALERAWAARDRWAALGLQAREDALAKFDPHPAQTMLHLLTGAVRTPAAGGALSFTTSES